MGYYDEYVILKCGDCGEIFCDPAEDGLRRDMCPNCNSHNISEVVDEGDYPDEPSGNLLHVRVR